MWTFYLCTMESLLRLLRLSIGDLAIHVKVDIRRDQPFTTTGYHTRAEGRVPGAIIKPSRHPFGCLLSSVPRWECYCGNTVPHFNSDLLSDTASHAWLMDGLLRCLSSSLRFMTLLTLHGNRSPCTSREPKSTCPSKATERQHSNAAGVVKASGMPSKLEQLATCRLLATS